jgi:hypothetical protein
LSNFGAGGWLVGLKFNVWVWVWGLKFNSKKEKGKKVMGIISMTLFRDKLPHLSHFKKKKGNGKCGKISGFKQDPLRNSVVFNN